MQYKEKTTLPLLILDVFNEDVKQIKGKEIGNLIFVDYCLQEHPSQTRETKYPVPVAIVQDKSDNTVYSTYPNSLKDLDCIGKVITNPKFKCTYTVVSVRDKYNALYNSRDPYYTVKNSITKETREIHYKETEEAFMFDGTGKLISSLLNVENSTNKKGVVGNNSYSDDLIDMAILAEEYQFSFILNNRSNNSIKIIWNDAVFVDIDGSTSKIMHSGIKYVDKEKDQPASVIVKGAKLEDIAIPVQKVFYHNFEWSNQSLFEKADKKIKGQTIKLMLPIQIGNSIIEYVFEFGLVYKYDHPELLVE